MSYADRETTGSRVTAIITVSFLVALFGYAFISGLAVQSGKKLLEKLNAFDVAPPPPPPPPDKPPPPPPDQPNLPPPPTVPTTVTPPMNLPSPLSFPPSPPAPPTLAPPSPPAPPAPPPPPAAPSQAVGAKPKGSPTSWFTNDDYPADARRAQAAGRVSVRLSIDAAGRVADCQVTASSGNGSLDSQTCNLSRRRGRFTPAKDAAGNGIPGSYVLSFRWQLQDE